MGEDDARVRQALDALEGMAGARSAWATHDPAVRAAYGSLIRTFSRRIWNAYKAGHLSAEQAAGAAHEARNFILEISRLVSTPEGRRAAQAMKANGRTFGALQDYYASKLFGRTFPTLADAERTKVFEAIIESAGRSNAGVNSEMRALGASSRIFWALTILMATYDIASARDKVTATVHVLAVLSAGILVGEVFGGVIGSFAGPIGTGAGVIVGGILGGWLVDHFAYHDADPALTGH